MIKSKIAKQSQVVTGSGMQKREYDMSIPVSSRPQISGKSADRKRHDTISTEKPARLESKEKIICESNDAVKMRISPLESIPRDTDSLPDIEAELAAIQKSNMQDLPEVSKNDKVEKKKKKSRENSAKVPKEKDEKKKKKELKESKKNKETKPIYLPTLIEREPEIKPIVERDTSKPEKSKDKTKKAKSKTRKDTHKEGIQNEIDEKSPLDNPIGPIDKRLAKPKLKAKETKVAI